MRPALTRKEWTELLLMLLLVLLSRLPLLNYGYGAEEDSWGIVRFVTQTHDTGVYEESRLPGHPVHEGILLLASHAGPWFYNGLSAVMSALAALFFALCLRRIGFRHYLFPTFALAFTPVIYISSTYTIDFTTTLAFSLASLLLLMTERFVLGGILLGLAVGCRITSLALLLPYTIIFSGLFPLRENYPSLLRFMLPALFVSVICYVPVFAVHGPGFFNYSDQFPYPPLTKVIYKATIGVFGLIGTTALLVAKAGIIRNRFSFCGPMDAENKMHKRIILASFICCAIYLAAYFRLPQKSGYLIPMLPFVLLLFAYYLKENAFRWFCFSMVTSSFFFSVNLTDSKRGAVYSAAALRMSLSGQEIFIDPLTGPLYSDHSKRIQKMIYTDQVIRACEAQRSANFVVISGWWYNELLVTLNERGMSNLEEHFAFYSTRPEMEERIAEGAVYYYLPEQDLYNDLYSGMEGTSEIARPFGELKWK